MLATLMQALDTTIANVALPYIQGSVSATQDQIAWVLTSYIVAAAIMTPPTGFLAARFGLKGLFLTAVAGFTIASMLCGMAQSLVQIVLFRILQGAFGAALVPLSQSVLLTINPPERQGSAMAMWGVAVMAGPILGPVLGGWLTENYSWRYVFYINVPIGILCFLGMRAFLTDTARNAHEKLDWFGFGTLSLGIGAMQLLLDPGEEREARDDPASRARARAVIIRFFRLPLNRRHRWQGRQQKKCNTRPNTIQSVDCHKKAGATEEARFLKQLLVHALSLITARPSPAHCRTSRARISSCP
jgi:EmrB/QacA subfamily drug resistance transporter